MLASKVLRRTASLSGLEPGDAIALLVEKLLMQAGRSGLRDLLALRRARLRAALMRRMQQAILDDLSERRELRALRAMVNEVVHAGVDRSRVPDLPDPSSLYVNDKLCRARVEAAARWVVHRDPSVPLNGTAIALKLRRFYGSSGAFADESTSPEADAQVAEIVATLRRALPGGTLEDLALRSRGGLQAVAAAAAISVATAHRRLQRAERSLAEVVRSLRSDIGTVRAALEQITTR